MTGVGDPVPSGWGDPSRPWTVGDGVAPSTLKPTIWTGTAFSGGALSAGSKGQAAHASDHCKILTRVHTVSHPPSVACWIAAAAASGAASVLARGRHHHGR